MAISKFVKLVGAKGILLQLYKQMQSVPIPINVPIFGKIKTYHEILNLYDNLAIGELRDEKIESHIKSRANPCIVDCGVNVGITIRWWFYLNKTAQVYGVDMLEETHDFIKASLNSLLLAKKATIGYSYNPVTCCLHADDGNTFEVNVDDPLRGTNSLFSDRKTETRRKVLSKTLNSICRDEQIREVDLLKIDIEGAAGFALQGADQLLGVTKHIIIETHDEIEDECKIATKILFGNGFVLRKVASRNLYWEKA